VDNVIPSNNLKHFNLLEPGVDELTRSTLLELLLHEAQKSCLTRQQLDRIDCHMAALRKLIYRQVELVEKDKLKGHNVARTLKLLATMNDLMANYQTLLRRIRPGG
jgi:DNA repair protein RadC